MPSLRSRMLWGGAFLGLFLIGAYFRTYSVHGFYYRPGIPRTQAEAMVLERIRNQIQAQIETANPQMPTEVARTLAAGQAASIRKTDAAQFEATVQKLEGKKGRSASKRSRTYLLEADPYYYLHLTNQILDHGALSPQMKEGRFFNRFRLWPKGVWSFDNLHPYVGAVFFRVISLFAKDLDRMEVLGWVPVLLLLPILLTFYWFANVLRRSQPALLIAAMVLLISPVAIQRGFYGWYDTDPYNYVFPFAILALVFQGIRGGKRNWAAIGAGFLTSFYALFWNGWLWIFLIVGWLTLSAKAITWVRPLNIRWTPLRFLGFYLLSSGLGFTLLMTPSGLASSVREAITALPKFAGMETNLWPNIFLTVGETRSIGIAKLIHLIANPTTFTAVLLGWIGYGWRRLAQKAWESLAIWGLLWSLALPLLILALRTERFSILFSIPFAIGVAFATDFVFEMTAWFVGRWPRFQKIFKMALTGLWLALLLPMGFLYAHAVSMSQEPIMNDDWFRSLQVLREKTPEHSVVYSWWPPGHFITSIAERAVIADGASQHQPECYWLARFFMEADEEKALRILRMMYAGGNRAVELLEEGGLSTRKAIERIEQLLDLSPEEARRQIVAWEGIDREALRNALFGAAAPGPAFIYLYDEMVDQVLALSFVAGWNFAKAERFHEESLGRVRNPFSRKEHSLRRLNEISDGFMKYQSYAKTRSTQGSEILFENGLVVDLVTKESRIENPAQGIRGEPYSLFVSVDAGLEEIPNSKNLLDVSALVYQRGIEYESVLADRRMIRSILFRLFYAEGRGLSHFRTVYRADSGERKDGFQIFEVVW
ncbi:MAG: STT3 domain-containing protein [Candidatus Omnitrophota bacterium]